MSLVSHQESLNVLSVKSTNKCNKFGWFQTLLCLISTSFLANDANDVLDSSWQLITVFCCGIKFLLLEQVYRVSICYKSFFFKLRITAVTCLLSLNNSYTYRSVTPNYIFFVLHSQASVVVQPTFQQPNIRGYIWKSSAAHEVGIDSIMAPWRP